MSIVPIINKNYQYLNRIFKIENPEIISGSKYYFITDSKLEYQVSFGKKKDNYLNNIVNFSVLSEEFEDEYSETNRGELYIIISTLTEIVRRYHDIHPYSNSYEFSGEYKDDEEKTGPSIRTRLYYRTIKRVVDHEYWEIQIIENKLILARKPRND